MATTTAKMNKRVQVSDAAQPSTTWLQALSQIKVGLPMPEGAAGGLVFMVRFS